MSCSFNPQRRIKYNTEFIFFSTARELKSMNRNLSLKRFSMYCIHYNALLYCSIKLVTLSLHPLSLKCIQIQFFTFRWVSLGLTFNLPRSPHVSTYSLCHCLGLVHVQNAAVCIPAGIRVGASSTCRRYPHSSGAHLGGSLIVVPPTLAVLARRSVPHQHGVFEVLVYPLAGVLIKKIGGGE